jgi:hypothetical protein
MPGPYNPSVFETVQERDPPGAHGLGPTVLRTRPAGEDACAIGAARTGWKPVPPSAFFIIRSARGYSGITTRTRVPGTMGVPSGGVNSTRA